jgi:hypothetical protein
MMRALPVVLLCGCWDFAGLGGLYAPDGAGVGGGAASDLGDDTDLALADLAGMPADVDLAGVDLTGADLAHPDLSPPPDLGPPDLAAIPSATGFSSRTSGTTQPLLAVGGTGPNDVWIVGQSIILHSTGGAFATDWSGSASLEAVWAAAPNAIWAVGAGGTILKTNKAGNWHPEPSGTSADLHGVWGAGGTLWAAGTGVILRSTGNGSWSSDWSDGNSTVQSVHGCAADDVWAAGVYSTSSSSSGLFVHRDASGWTTTLTGASEIVQHVVCVAGGAHAVGGALGTPGPRVYDFDGSSWSSAALAGDGALFALWAGPSGELYAAGYGGAIWRRLPGGVWSALGSPTSDALWGLWGSSSADVYAVGDAGTLLHLP